MIKYILATFLCCQMVSAETSQVYKIGISTPLTGAVAEFGISNRNGTELEIKDNPELFKNVKFIYDDHQYDPKQAISSFHKLVQTEQVDILFVWGSGPCLAVAPIAEQAKVPTFCFAGDQKPNLKYVVGFVPPFVNYSRELRKYLDTEKISSISAVVSEIPFLVNVQHAMEDEYSQRQDVETIPAELVEPSVQDFRSIILKLKSKKIDALALFLLPHQLVPFLQQAEQLHYRPRVLFGADTFNAALARPLHTTLLKGTASVDLIAKQEFTDRYTTIFNTEDNVTFAANAYEFAILAAKLLQSGAGGDQIIHRLREQEHGDGVAGAWQYRESAKYGQYVEFPLAVTRW